MGLASGRPDDMDAAAGDGESFDGVVRDALTTARSRYDSFRATNRWGVFEADGLLGSAANGRGVHRWLALNGEDTDFVRAVAEALRRADAAGQSSLEGVLVVEEEDVAQYLAEAGIAVERELLEVELAQAGVQLTSGYQDDPVNTASGNFLEVEVDLGFGPSLGWLQWRRTYNSLDASAGPLGPGWSSWASTRLAVSGGGGAASWQGPDGQHMSLPSGGSGVPGFGGRVEPDPAGDGWIVLFDRGVVWHFGAEGRPVRLDDPVRGGVRLSWDDDRLVCLSHASGRAIDLSWGLEQLGGRIVGARTDDGREVVYRYDGRGRLVGVDGPLGARTYVWDARDRITAVVDADGVTVASNEYDAAGRVLAQTAPEGNRSGYRYRPGRTTTTAGDGVAVVWEHDRAGRLVAVRDPAGHGVGKSYDAAGRVTSVSDRRGNVTRCVRDDRGRVARRVFPDGSEVSYAWDDLDRPVTISGPEGRSCSYSYRGDERTPSTITGPDGVTTQVDVTGGLVRSFTGPDGAKVGFGYDDQRRPTSITAPDGAVTRFEWDPTGQVAAVVDARGARTVYERDSAGRVAAAIDPTGAAVRYCWTPGGRISEVIDPAGATTSYRYNEAGLVESVTDPAGGVTRCRWDANGNLTGITGPDGATMSYTYDDLSRITTVTDAEGATTAYGYDAEGRVVSVTGPAGEIVGFGYDDMGRPAEVTDLTGAVTRYAYDAAGRLVEVTDAAGGVVRYAYDAAGRLVEVTDLTGAVTRYAYDAAGRLVEVTDAAGGVVRGGYDPAGRLVQVEDGEGAVLRCERDGAGRIASVTDPAGNVTSYDPEGRECSVTDPWGAELRYDAAGRVIAVSDPLGGTVRYSYDDRGCLVSVTDPAGETVTCEHDEAGHLCGVVDGLGRRWSYAYDDEGRLVERVDPDGAVWHQRWDADGSLAGWEVSGETVGLVRDDSGRLIRVERDGEGVVTREWDPSGNLLAETTPGYTMSWDYDEAGRAVAATVVPAESGVPATTRYGWDEAGHIRVVDDPALGRIVIDRDEGGWPLRVSTKEFVDSYEWESGLLAGWARDPKHGGSGVGVRYGRDGSGRVVSEEHRDGRRVGYDYDRAGQLVGVEDSVAGTSSFEWDACGRLVGEHNPEGEVRYSYDRAGQLTRVVTSEGETRIFWDACGRRVREWGPAGERRYEWNRLGQLAAIITTSRGGGGSATRRLDVDPLGRLTGVDRVPLCWDSTKPVAPLWAVGDHRMVSTGSHAIVDGDGDIDWRAMYPGGRTLDRDPWGVGGTEASLPAGLGLGVRGELAVDGLVWLRARVYDPATRSFLSPDPLPSPAGAPWGANRYQYAGNDPVGFADPSGLIQVTDYELFLATQGWDRGAWDRYGGYVVGGIMIAGGIALIATGVGAGAGVGMMLAAGAVSGALIAGGASAVTQQAFAGEVNWAQVGTESLIGAATGLVSFGAGSVVTAATRGATVGLRTTAQVGTQTLVGGGTNVLGGAAVREYHYDDIDTWDPGAVLLDATVGSVIGGLPPTVQALRNSRPTPPPTTGPTPTGPTPTVYLSGNAGHLPPRLTPDEIRRLPVASNDTLDDVAGSPPPVSTRGTPHQDAGRAPAPQAIPTDLHPTITRTPGSPTATGRQPALSYDDLARIHDDAMRAQPEPLLYRDTPRPGIVRANPEQGTYQSGNAGPRPITVYRYYNPNQPNDLRPPLSRQDSANQWAENSQLENPRYASEQAMVHMGSPPPTSPFVSMTIHPQLAAEAPDNWLQSIVRGAPRLGRFEVPSDRLVWPRFYNHGSIAEGEVLFWGDDLADFLAQSSRNPYRTPAPLRWYQEMSNKLFEWKFNKKYGPGSAPPD